MALESEISLSQTANTLCLTLRLLQLMHWIGFAGDEVLFRRYRRVRVQVPVFIVGVPRSGTTFLRRLIASDTRFTTFSTWECLFAPSICERLVYRAIAGADRRIGRSLGRLVDRAEARLLNDPDRDPPPQPKANAIAERWVRTVRAQRAV